MEGWSMISLRLSGSRVSEIFKRGLDSLKEAGSEYNVYLGELDVSEISSDVLKQVIGKEGCYFIKTTEQCDLDFVWHNRDTKKIEFWGPKDNIDKGISAIKYRIYKKTPNIPIKIE